MAYEKVSPKRRRLTNLVSWQDLQVLGYIGMIPVEKATSSPTVFSPASSA